MGERQTITTLGGVGGGCNSKRYLLIELLLDRTNSKEKVPGNTGLLRFANGKYRQATVANHSFTSQVS